MGVANGTREVVEHDEQVKKEEELQEVDPMTPKEGFKDGEGENGVDDRDGEKEDGDQVGRDDADPVAIAAAAFADDEEEDDENDDREEKQESQGNDYDDDNKNNEQRDESDGEKDEKSGKTDQEEQDEMRDKINDTKDIPRDDDDDDDTNRNSSEPQSQERPDEEEAMRSSQGSPSAALEQVRNLMKQRLWHTQDFVKRGVLRFGCTSCRP